MSVFRVEKTRDYTVMSNHHLKNNALTLKAKGLLSVILSLPEDWDYTLKGLAIINREGIDAIREAIRELERAGYVQRTRERDGQGKLRGTDYVIYEYPQHRDEDEPEPGKPMLDAPALGKPMLEKPMLENPTLEKPAQENPTQLNNHRSTPYPKIKEKSKTHPCRTHQSNPYQSAPEPAEAGVLEDEYWRTRSEVRKNIGYDSLKEDYDSERLDEIVEIITETLCTTKHMLTVAGEPHPAWLVKERLREINSTHVEYVFECLKRSAPRIRNIKQYLLTTLFNAPATISSYYNARVEHEYLNS